MRYTLCLLCCLCRFYPLQAQPGLNANPPEDVLTPSQTKQIFSDSIKKNFNILYPITMVYHYQDRDGHFYIALTENAQNPAKPGDNLYNKIKAFCFKMNASSLALQWQLNDFVKPSISDQDGETTIWFWTRYTVLKDLDLDGYTDPILVYGSNGSNRFDDGRIKIMIFHKGQKIAIRHQNGVLDRERNTQVDTAFYSLPLSIQDHVKGLMQQMTDDAQAIFPYGWQNAMKNYAIKFDERKR